MAMINNPLVFPISIPLSFLVAFIVTFIMLPRFISYLRAMGLTGTDIQKADRPKIPEMGGPAVLAGFLSGVFFYIWLELFFFKSAIDLTVLFAATISIMIIVLVGMLDDLSRLFKYAVPDAYGNEKRLGIRRWQKVLFTLPAAIPLMAISAGDASMVLPLLGRIDIGILYPLLLVPIAIMGASNATNMLAGFNGLEAGLGVVVLSMMGIYAAFLGNITAEVFAFMMVAALLAFLRYNWYPAKIFPADSLNLAIGAAIATMAIIGNMERIAILAFLPWILEAFLKLRSRIETKKFAECFGVLQSDNTLAPPAQKVYSVTHIVMRIGRLKEWQVTLMLVGFEALLCASLLYFYLVYV